MDSPADILAAARLNPVGPYLPAREEWLTGWTGPLTVRASGVSGTRPAGGLHPAIACDGGVLYDDDPSGEPGWQYVDRSDIGAEWGTVAEVLLDARRSEVRALLIRHGCPEWARDVPAAVWAWGNGAGPWDAYGRWGSDRGLHYRDPVCGHHRVWVYDTAAGIEGGYGWAFGHPAEGSTKGSETGPEGRALVDVTALRGMCVLEEPGGWYVPLPGGGVGWWAKEVSDGS